MTGVLRGKLEDYDYAHGTCARYVAGCRCQECRDAKSLAARERVKRVHAAAAELKPNGPPLDGTLMRAGVVRRVKLCPGTEGRPCVKGGAWLRTGGDICTACVDRATVWNGLVDAGPARAHIMALSQNGVGRHAVADASDVAHSLIAEVRAGRRKQIRRAVEKRILAVDEGARADGGYIKAWPTRTLIQNLLARRFTYAWISKELGYVGTFAFDVLNSGRPTVRARVAAAIEKLHRRVVEHGIRAPPYRGLVPTPRKLIRHLLRVEGYTVKGLSAAVGFHVVPSVQTMKIRHVAALEKLYAQVTAEGGEIAQPMIDPGIVRRLLAAHRDGVGMADLVERFGHDARKLSEIIRWASEPGAVIG